MMGRCFSVNGLVLHAMIIKTIQAIADLIADAEHATGEQGSIGVGIPGTLSPLPAK